MRQEMLDAYWDVVREGLSFKEAADRHGVNRGTLHIICKTSIISRPVGKPATFDEFEEFIMASYIRSMQVMERPLIPQQILDGVHWRTPMLLSL